MLILAEYLPFLRLGFIIVAAAFPLSALGHNGSSVAKGQWQEFDLAVKKRDNWSIEHCFELEGQHKLAYHFESALAVTLNLHLHPKTPNKQYLTEHLAKVTSKHLSEGSVVAPSAGTYCFDFTRAENQLKDSVIHLKYKVD